MVCHEDGSGELLRAALQVVDAISQGRSLWIAIFNSITSLPPEVRRRFTLGTFFFDLPTAEEREAIWNIYEQRWQLTGERPDDNGWTGAEIKKCCRKACRLKLSLRESAGHTVPASRSASNRIEALRRQASGQFLSAESSDRLTTPEGATPICSGRRLVRPEMEWVLERRLRRLCQRDSRPYSSLYVRARLLDPRDLLTVSGRDV